MCFKIPDLVTIATLFAGYTVIDASVTAFSVIWSLVSINVDAFISFDEIQGIVPCSQKFFSDIDGVFPPDHFPKSASGFIGYFPS